ncbi:unnamed protein product [Leuciscus chuanchicus]
MIYDGVRSRDVQRDSLETRTNQRELMHVAPPYASCVVAKFIREVSVIRGDSRTGVRAIKKILPALLLLNYQAVYHNDWGRWVALGFGQPMKKTQHERPATQTLTNTEHRLLTQLSSTRTPSQSVVLN